MRSPDLKTDFERISTCKPPVRRAAYSDRTAWLMAILAELAYTRFDEEDDSALINLAEELAGLGDPSEVADRRKAFKASLVHVDRDGNDTLRRILAVGGFDLRGVLFDAATDTQGFVAAPRTESGWDLAVVSFRGTQQVQDWMTNLKFDKEPVHKRSQHSPRRVGEVHRGCNQAFLSVETQIRQHLKELFGIPLYITGHSLGGALATLATWYISADALAACYTFGSPRVGDGGLTNHFRTPIYRIVNGADPVPFVPPATAAVDFVKGALRLSIAVIPIIGPWLDKALNWIVSKQGYRHYGFQRYLTICEPGEDGSFPNLRNEYGVSSLGRLWRLTRRLLRGEAGAKKRLDKYHDISLYRHKLRAFAIRRWNEFPIHDDAAGS